MGVTLSPWHPLSMAMLAPSLRVYLGNSHTSLGMALPSLRKLSQTPLCLSRTPLSQQRSQSSR